jgi:hypothetical protein
MVHGREAGRDLVASNAPPEKLAADTGRCGAVRNATRRRERRLGDERQRVRGPERGETWRLRSRLALRIAQ